MIANSTILITGGTGYFGKALTRQLFMQNIPARIIIYSRNENKQSEMKKELEQYADRIFFFRGDIAEKECLLQAFENVDYVVHAAAMKVRTDCEKNPALAMRTNFEGAWNVVEAAVKTNVKKVIAISTDNAVAPVSIYGGTKHLAENLFLAANSYAENRNISFSVVRFGNIIGSPGSVIPVFASRIKNGASSLTVTDEKITKFWMDMEQATELVTTALNDSQGGEIFIAKTPSYRIFDLAKAMLPDGTIEITGISKGEKLYETMISKEDAPNTYAYGNHYVIYPKIKWNDRIKQIILPDEKKVTENFEFRSDNARLLSIEEIKKRVALLLTDTYILT